MENKMKKDVQLWIRGNSKGELDINKLENFTLICIEDYDKMDSERDLETRIEFVTKDVVSYKKNNDEFEIWFEVKDALDIWRYPEKFKIDEKFSLPFQDSNGDAVHFELTVFKVRYDFSETFNLL